ncbi:MAG: hypothetical protein AUG51_21855 [Acidobacteria bacterium 13_1_20CM_3_53_8]|nr:MAG: hypothetical protein AUG51_21855 [Acidobacteria bacterium 13_1_20CM_3_53_8]
MSELSHIIHSLWFQLTSIVIIATVHGYAAAWLAIRMLFRPYNPVKFLGVTIWPQGMIPRHRERLAQSIGRAVGSELVSQETVFDALFENDFFRRKVGDFVENYTNDLLATRYPSFIEALPAGARAPVLDTISALQLRLAEHIAATLRNEETAAAIERFVDERIDALLSRRLNETISDEGFDKILGFIEERFRNLVTEENFVRKVRDFVGSRLDEIANSQTTLAEMLTPNTVAIVKERVDQQLPPIVHELAELATSQQTRMRIGGLIKHEVDDYYTQLSFFKKIFISRERIHHEVDDLVNKTLPRRVEEFLLGDAFEQQAELFLNTTIDNVLARPINELIGQIAPDKLQIIKDQISDRLLTFAQSAELSDSVSAYITDAMHRLRPHSLRALLQTLNPDSSQKVKTLLTKGLLSIITRDETARTINAILSAQVEKLLVAPIGRLGDHMPDHAVRTAAAALTDRIVEAARERLPTAIAEFDVGGIVRKKVSEYPLEKLEELVLSVAEQHLKKIEMFGAVIGLFIGIVQAIYFWYFAHR